jgi:FMN-dependent oxidoreductase (nitrilotriacetate monooxygenase family)
MTQRHLHLNAFLMNVGHHEAAWRHPDTDPRRALGLDHFVELARTAERGLLDSIFFADLSAVRENVRHNTQGGLDPVDLLAAVTPATRHVGLIATVSTSFHEPFNLARRFATLDHLSGGRAGWNIVTSGTDAEARNFGAEAHAAHADRYERAAEFVDVVTKLWDSWDDDVLVVDRASGVYADTDRIRRINHRGRHFRVDGPLTLPRSPQGRPLLVQAGSSETGREFAARYADAVFTAQQTLAEAQGFARNLRSRLGRHGRGPEDVVILPGISPIIGGTAAEARRLAADLDDLLVHDYGLDQLSGMVGVTLTEADLDGPLPEVPPEADINGNKSRRTLVVDLARREHLTVRQIISRLAGGRGHRVVAGTPEAIADTIEEWFHAGAADGFNVMPPLLPSGLDAFVDHVVPILQTRGLFRREYEGTTLRDRYGLTRPQPRLDPAASPLRERPAVPVGTP